MLTLIKLLPIIIILAATAAFFGFVPNEKKGKAPFYCALVGLVLITSVIPMGMLIEQPVLFFARSGALLFAAVMLIIALVLSLVEPYAPPKRVEGPYQKMSPKQKKTFWRVCRLAAKFAVNRYAAGNSGFAADAAKFTSRFV